MKNNHYFRNIGPLNTSFEGLMLGNGSIGALIYGSDNLVISLDLVSLWDKRLPGEFKDKNFNYPYMLDCINNDYAKLYKLFDDCYLHPYPTKLNAGRLFFKDIKINKDTLFEICFDNGTFKFKNEDYLLSGYIDANKDVFVINSNRKLDFDFILSKYFYQKEEDRGLDYPPSKYNEEGSFRYIYQKMYGNKHFYIICKEIKENNGYVYLFTIQKDTYLLKGKAILNSYYKNITKNHDNHNLFWDLYYKNGVISTPDEKINDLYIKGLYYFGSNSRKKYPLTLQGVWTQNNDNLPPWKSDLHNDINVEMTYDYYFISNHKDEGKVLVDYLYSHRSAFKKFAKDFMGSKGLLIPGVMSQDGLPLGGWPQYALSPMVSIWILKVFDDYYSYYGDKKFLNNRCFYFFKNTELCIRKYLIINKDGYLESDFHSSPEFFENEERSLFKNQTNFEITMLRYLYSKLVEYSKILNLDYSYYQSQLDLISPYFRDEDGYLKISKDVSFLKSHRHFSHMLMYKNLPLVNIEENKEIIKKDIDHLVSFSTSEWVGFSFVEASGLYSLIGDGDNAYKYLKIFIDAFIHPNGFHMNSDYKHLGYSDLNCYVMTLEANMGANRSILDMLISFHDEILTLFPSIPNSWKDKETKFFNLNLPRNIEVNATRNKGRIILFSLESKTPFSIKIRNNLKDNPVLKVDGKKITFESKFNEIIVLSNASSVEYEDN